MPKGLVVAAAIAIAAAMASFAYYYDHSSHSTTVRPEYSAVRARCSLRRLETIHAAQVSDEHKVAGPFPTKVGERTRSRSVRAESTILE